MKKINVRSLGVVAKMLDVLMIPVMYLVQGTLRERPQRTHRWNNQKLSPDQVAYLDGEQMVNIEGISSAVRAFFFGLPLLHIPVLGGWRHYVVVEPRETNSEWYVGWITSSVIGVSRIPLTGSVRLLRGPGAVKFFGVTKDGDQISLRHLGYGQIGHRGQYARAQLR